MSDEIDSNHHYQVRKSKLEDLKKLNIDPFPARVKRSLKAEELQFKYSNLENGQMIEENMYVVGRIISIRNSGMFIDLSDDTGKIQIYSDVKKLDINKKNILEKLDIGDFIEVGGFIRRTPRGELTINSDYIKIITKSLLPLPEKYHGLHDVELKYRKRYIDLLSNPDSKKNLLNRSRIISLIRNLLTEREFIEVETPMLHPVAGGAIAKPFVTYHNALDHNLYLRISPELYLKRLIIGNMSEKIFEINRCFRNEGISTKHNPEFTSVEIYQAYSDYNDMMDLTELIISEICMKINDSISSAFGDKILNFSVPWARKSMTELIKEETSIDFAQIYDDQQALEAARNLGLSLTGNESWGKIVEIVFNHKVESTLIQPIHVVDLPTDISPLAKAHTHDKRICERFETYINGWEISNGFSELNDPIEQEKRFTIQSSYKNQGDDEAHSMDEDFITALKHGMPPTGGLGIGIDRLVMLITDSHSIREIIAFPTLKPKL